MGGKCADLHAKMSDIDDPANEERRKMNELARNDATDFMDRGRTSNKSTPIVTSTPRQTATPDDASSVEMRRAQ